MVNFKAAFYIFLRRVRLYFYDFDLFWTRGKAEKSARDASQRERDAQKRLKEQQSLYEERISSLRIDLGKLKEAYLKLEKHNSKDKYKRMLIEKKSKLELTERFVTLPLRKLYASQKDIFLPNLPSFTSLPKIHLKT